MAQWAKLSARQSGQTQLFVAEALKIDEFGSAIMI
jgi:hypothetical protein